MFLLQKYRPTIFLIIVGFIMLFWFYLFGPLTIVYSSATILLLLIVFSLHYGVFSAPSIIINCAFFPSLAIFWAYLYNRPHISVQNVMLQDYQLWGETAVHLSMISLVFTLAVLLIFNKRANSTFTPPPKPYFLGEKAYIIFSLASAFFFWLAEPSFTTILTTPYTDIISARFNNTQYAGGVGILFWLFSVTTYIAKTEQENTVLYKKWPDRLFIFVTIIIVLWLFLHSRRNELIGIGITLIFCIKLQKGTLLANIFAVAFLALLLSIGFVRSTPLINDLGKTKQTPYLKQVEKNHPELTKQQHLRIARNNLKRAQKIKSLPSGASNVFMTYLTTIHYFDKHPLLNGQTFTNYFSMLLPTNLYRNLNIERPKYFYQHVLKKYDYKGGTYAAAIFYGNFGVFGAIAFGLFVGLYILLAAKSLNSSNIIIQIMGFYLAGMVFRGFWYEPIALIKPIAIVLLPSYIFFTLIHKYTSESSKQRLAGLIKWRL